MGLFGFGNKKQETKKENYSNEIYVNLPDEMTATAFGLKCVRSENGIDTYTGNLIIGRDGDTIIFSNANPISFEIPSNCKMLVDQLIKNYCQTRSNRELGNNEYTYIGDIRANENNELFYYNEGPSARTTNIIEEENKKLRQQMQERARQNAINEQHRLEEKQHSKFLEELKLNEQIQERESFEQEKRNARLNQPYVKMTRGIYGGEGYDIVDTNTGNILIMRNMKKFKDSSGRYMYTAQIRDTNEDTYTEYDPVLNSSYSKTIAFTMPTRLSDIVANQNLPQYKQYSNTLQWLISNTYSKINFKDRSLIDIGGVSYQGQYFTENSEKFGVSQALVSKLKSLGAKKIEERTR